MTTTDYTTKIEEIKAVLIANVPESYLNDLEITHDATDYIGDEAEGWEGAFHISTTFTECTPDCTMSTEEILAEFKFSAGL